MYGSIEISGLCACDSCMETTQSDYVEFSNFNVELTDRKYNRLCGSKESNIVKNAVYSDGSFFRVTFKSNDNFDSTGFEAEYQFRKTVDGRLGLK